MIEVALYEGGVHIRLPNDKCTVLSWPEANKLQADLRRICVEAGITLRDAI
jgi:hypothetical protein